jgi:hypothetical protein
LASQIWQLYVPAIRLLAVCVVCWFDQRYVQPPTPPEGVTVAEPVLSPLQITGVVLEVAETAVGSLTVTVLVATGGQLFASTIVQEYVFACKLVAR